MIQNNATPFAGIPSKANYLSPLALASSSSWTPSSSESSTRGGGSCKALTDTANFYIASQNLCTFPVSSLDTSACCCYETLHDLLGARREQRNMFDRDRIGIILRWSLLSTSKMTVPEISSKPRHGGELRCASKFSQRDVDLTSALSSDPKTPRGYR